MLQAGEFEGEQTKTARWRIPQSVVPALLEQRREQEQLRGSPERRLEAPEKSVGTPIEALVRRVAETGQSTKGLDDSHSGALCYRNSLEATPGGRCLFVHYG
jgi:hypothetical protein